MQDMTQAITRYICIHGHFYQPPRENPWLQSIERQQSAHPYHDWNERIAEECYTPNAHARILDNHGWLREIICNYAYISFNFGPTLLSWLETHTPETYETILQADSLSRSLRSGHGNAIAQPYNHMVMPLASRRDKITQVVWGIEDFRKRFRREPEGMWLPETAVDTETLEVLADHGISFTILAPGQASRFRSSPEEQWTDVDGSAIDPSRPYLCHLSGTRTIALFFYDAPISHAIAFEKLLDSGDRFRNHLMAAFNDERPWPQLVHVATDGESYGHHHRFGEMALAYSIEKILADQTVRLTNYAEFIAKHAPTAEAEFIQNSSWSCAHGVGRWSQDCGCSVSRKPNWNQKWRSSLRAAMDLLRDHVDILYEEQTAAFFEDAWDVRNAYVSVVLSGHSTVREFLSASVPRNVSDDDCRTLATLLEMQHNRMLMYTSCGWFFDDISGIETLQILRYAARVIQLAQTHSPELLTAFLKELHNAVSNVKPYMRGDELFLTHIVPQIADLTQVVAHLGIFSVFQNIPIRDSFYCYEIEPSDVSRYESGERVLLLGQVSVTCRLTMEARQLIGAVVYLGGLDFRCSVAEPRDDSHYALLKQDLIETFSSQSSTELIRKLDAYFPGTYFSLKDLFAEQRSEIIGTITRNMYEEQAILFQTFYNKNKELAKLVTNQAERVPDTFLASARFVLNRLFLSELHKLQAGIFPDALQSLIEESELWKIDLDLSSAEKLISARILRLVTQLWEDPFDEMLLHHIMQFLDLGEDLDIPLQLGESQIMFMRIVRSLQETPTPDFSPGFYTLAERLAVRLNNC